MKPTRCAALTRSGEPCKNPALAGSPYCRLHQPRNRSGPAGRRKNMPASLDRGTRQQLAAELDNLTRRAQAMSPAQPSWDKTPPPASPVLPNRQDPQPVPDLYDADRSPASHEKFLGLSLFDVALLGVGGWLLFKWLFRPKRTE